MKFMYTCNYVYISYMYMYILTLFEYYDICITNLFHRDQITVTYFIRSRRNLNVQYMYTYTHAYIMIEKISAMYVKINYMYMYYNKKLSYMYCTCTVHKTLRISKIILLMPVLSIATYNVMNMVNMYTIFGKAVAPVALQTLLTSNLERSLRNRW